ncbi:MAG: ATP-binding cassette domain-containing protein [Actinobacteria bacterium]|nr:ATP-binding cassette domain-containing protein [Actinomycetota bacterium]
MTAGLDARFTLRRSEAFRVDVALQIPPGVTVALLGPNGAGKSTVVAALAGLLPVDEGRVVLDGTVLDDPAAGTLVPPELRRVGVVFQDYLLFPHLSVLENVCFGLRSRGAPKDRAAAAGAEWLDRVGLGGMAARRPGDLSGGQAQRVALARALAAEPGLLLLDEPLAALDVSTRSGLRRALAEHLEAFGGPRLFITHDPAEAFLLADEIHVLEDGAVTQAGTADDIRFRPRTPYAADLAGFNLFRGTAAGATVDVGPHALAVADDRHRGPVLVTIQPVAVAVHLAQPTGSPRNTWATVVERVEDLGSRIRLQMGAPLPLAAEVTRAAMTEMGLEPGRRVWVAVKATEVGVEPGTGEG